MFGEIEGERYGFKQVSRGLIRLTNELTWKPSKTNVVYEVTKTKLLGADWRKISKR
jgi:hypothetical protein